MKESQKILCHRCGWPICFEIEPGKFEMKHSISGKEIKAVIIIGSAFCRRCGFRQDLPGTNLRRSAKGDKRATPEQGKTINAQSARSQ